MRPDDERYFDRIEARLDEAMAVAQRAKGQGKDPEPEVEIPIAQDMADRVENILGIPNVAERVRELEGQMSREEAALELAKDFAEGRVGDYDSKAGKIEGAVRTAVALLTEGVVAAPIEGIDRVELLDNDDGTQFVNVYYAGPIRSAGGTAQALSVLVADYTRSILGLAEYNGRDEEIERYVEEINLYDKDTGLQYSPKDKETRFISTNMPIMLDGEATGDLEVSGYRDLDRVDTNSSRGGMCLVMAEGIALKAPKIQRYTRQLDEVDWPWLQDLIDGTIEGDKDASDEDTEEASEDDDDSDAEADDSEAGKAEKPDGPARVKPKSKYLLDLIAGRPVFGHPSESGGFRLRYGRARNLGFATAGVHPATMHIIDDFLATGTQIKTERPGKAAGIIPVDSIEGPTVRLATGEVRRIDDPEAARELKNGVEKILDIGEYLVNYGEFVENNHPLAPASYVYEWWVQEFEAAGADVQAFLDDPHVDLESPTAAEALRWASEYDCPLHPTYTYVWHDISVDDFETLAEAVVDGAIIEDSDRGELLVVDRTETVQTSLETLLVAHHQTDETIEIHDWLPLARSLGVSEDLIKTWDELSEAATGWDGGDNAVKAVNEVAPFEVRERAPTRIGARMGRPEKSESRDLSPAVHTLFPITEAGGNQRDVAAAARNMDDQGRRGVHSMQINQRLCPDCETKTFTSQCPDCGTHTEPHYECDDCEVVCEPDEAGRVVCPRCERDVTAAEWQEVDLRSEYRGALESITEREGNFEILKGVKGLTSANKTPEAIEKGILRSKHGVSSFKDGTVRYDMTDLPVTAVKPEELDVTVEHFRGLGYETDINGDPLQHDDQVIELKVQDIVLSDGAAEHMLKTADFVDDLLERFYGQPAFYDVDERDELIGELVFGMAPHTSAAVVGRVVGFTSAAVGYAHPYFHAAKRRNCFHPETKLWYEDERGVWHHETIETLVEGRLDDPVTDDLGTLVEELDDTVSVPSVGENGSVVTKPVEALSKHPAPDHMVEIETRSGRELSVTPDHKLQVFENGKRRTKRAAELTEGDSLIKPERLSSVQPAEEYPTFDLLAEFIRIDAIDNSRLMIKGIEKATLYELFETKLADEWDGQFYPLKSTAEYFEMSHKTLSNYLYRGSVPAEILLELCGSVDDVVAFVPDDVRLGMKRDSTEIDRIIEVTEDVATLLGYYAAEGFAREQSTQKGTIHQTTICGTEAEARNFYVETFESAFSVSPYHENDAKVTVSGRLVRTFFDTVLDAGIYSKTKRVPQCIFDAPDEVVAAYLRGYFSGDGSADSNALDVYATTVSRELKEDLLALLTRLGIVGSATITEPVPLCEKFPDDYDIDDPSMSARSYVLHISSHDAVDFAERVGFHLSRKETTLQAQVDAITPRQCRVFDGGSGDYLVESVASVEYVESDTDYTYCLTVKDTHSLIVNDLSQNQCDGDEDCVMLLMDGLLNFSREFLPNKRGGRMDAPLVMSSRIDPAEIDDEAHNMDIVDTYPQEFYEATLEKADPESVDIQIGDDTLGTKDQYRGFNHTHSTTDIHMGPSLSAYKTLGSMMDKMDAQLELARKLRAVDETDVAERVIEYHFLPDLIGNLRAFSSQKTRCLDCEEKYRRMPLSGECRECGGRVNLTVHQGSVNKYMDTAIEVAERFGCREYTKQRLRILERSLESVFENDKNKQSGIADFM